ncbi:MAG: hypothetical protein ACK47B_12140 [Armatimonadota bacterium]
MDLRLPALNKELTPCQDALERIVEVFQDGYQAAANLRSSAENLTPIELRGELEAIEQRMLSQISSICVTYEIREASPTRH